MYPRRHTMQGRTLPPFVTAGTGRKVIHICDLTTRQISALSRSEGLWASRWSSGGSYIAALATTSDELQRLKVYDLEPKKRRDLCPDGLDNPPWSRHRKHIHFGRRYGDGPGVFRFGSFHLSTHQGLSVENRQATPLHSDQ